MPTRPGQQWLVGLLVQDGDRLVASSRPNAVTLRVTCATKRRQPRRRLSCCLYTVLKSVASVGTPLSIRRLTRSHRNRWPLGKGHGRCRPFSEEVAYSWRSAARRREPPSRTG